MADIFYHNFLKAMADGTVDVDTDVIKCMLVTDSYTPNADHTVKADLVANEIANGNGYTTGGVTVAVTVTDDDANDKFVFDVANPSWTASGGAIGPFRYAIFYNDTHASDALIYCYDFGSNQTANSGASITIIIDVNGLFTIA
jgi:hypothetical protein